MCMKTCFFPWYYHNYCSKPQPLVYVYAYNFRIQILLFVKKRTYTLNGPISGAGGGGGRLISGIISLLANRWALIYPCGLITGAALK